ncbi:MAG: DMT family transporter [Aestuariibacter sp.]
MSTRPLYGFFLSLLTAVMWGVLPLFLTLTLRDLDAVSITCFRFLFAAIVVFLVLKIRNEFPVMRQFQPKVTAFLVMAGLGLTINYVANVKGLELIDPESAQVIIQTAPFMLMLGGILIFKESFTRLQKTGATVLLIGFALFFEENLQVLFSGASQYTAGVLTILFAALAWAFYALIQKWLFSFFTARQLTLVMYGIGAVVLMPFTQWSGLWQLSWLTGLALLFCCVNTLVGYGAFTAAMGVWQASKVSAVISLAPVFTILSMMVAVWWFPDYFVAAEIGSVAYFGAGLVVLGSMLTSLGKRDTVTTETRFDIK